jgi:uncharacterized membrane protein YidH (DUF202 family)
MDFLYRIQIAAAERLRWLAARSQRDRGDSPVPSAVIIVGLVLVAGIVIVALGTLVRGYLAQAPASVPQP